MSKSNKPRYGRAGRSAAFQTYLDAQTPERQREIVAQESAYLATRVTHDAHGVNPQEQAYVDSMEGYEDHPAGGSQTAVDGNGLLSLVPGGYGNTGYSHE